jgi:glutaredoxin
MEGYVMEEKRKISDDFLTEYLVDFGSSRGCTLLGKTSFDKLKAVQDLLSGQGHRFEVVDCPKEARDADSVTKMAKKYQKVPYVIFNRCEGILCRDDVLKVFAHLLDIDEYDIWFPTESFYVFLGDKNTIPQETDYPVGEHEEDHIASFRTYVNCYDFDKDRQAIPAIG